MGTPGRRAGPARLPALAALAASLAACEPLEFYELTEPVPGTAGAAVSFNTLESETLTAHLAVQLRDWGVPLGLPRVLLEGTELPAEPGSDDRRAMFQHGWTTEPRDLETFPLTLLIPPPTSADPAAGIELALPALARVGPHAICPSEDRLSLDYAVRGALPESRHWSLELTAPGSNRLRLTGAGLPTPSLAIPHDLISIDDGATALLVVHAHGQLRSDPDVVLSVSYAIRWIVPPQDEEGGCTT